MAIELQWIHHASFRIQAREGVLYIDPWKLENPRPDADVIFVSHCHYDHCSPEDIEKISKPETAIVAPAQTIEQLHAANAVTPGESAYVRDIQVEAVAAYNVGKTFHPRQNNWVGAVFTIDKTRIYYAGDTDLIPEMNDLKEIDLALLPVGGTYTLDANQAAKAVKAIGPKLAIPYHWGDIVGSRADAQRFVQASGRLGRLLEPGQTVSL
jgi:L-ascorbate metabolism protein UlaG (beta-lactamase superfamily)